jgi:hypothetical protein
MASWDKKDYYQKSESENEEDEALEKLRRRAEVLKDSDFLPDFTDNPEIAQLTEDEVIEIIERDSPEMLTVLESIPKVIKSYKKGLKDNDLPLIGYCKILAVHLSFYLLLKAHGKSATNHPVVQQIKNLEKKIVENKEKVFESESSLDNSSDLSKDLNQENGENKRKVDEKIKKNKGIVKKRKKIERNVRVKNKMKYLKKVKIRRATLGIKEVEDRSRYSGESTGIRKNIVKSVKLA